MQVILLEKIHHLGELGAVVKVKDGYARNFLIPQGHAKRATKAAIAEFETRRAELEKAQAERIAAAQAVADKLNGQTIEIASKVGVDGRLFGSVTNADIAEAVDIIPRFARRGRGDRLRRGGAACRPAWTGARPMAGRVCRAFSRRRAAG